MQGDIPAFALSIERITTNRITVSGGIKPDFRNDCRTLTAVHHTILHIKYAFCLLEDVRGSLDLGRQRRDFKRWKPRALRNNIFNLCWMVTSVESARDGFGFRRQEIGENLTCIRIVMFEHSDDPILNVVVECLFWANT